MLVALAFLLPRQEPSVISLKNRHARVTMREMRPNTHRQYHRAAVVHHTSAVCFDASNALEPLGRAILIKPCREPLPSCIVYVYRSFSCHCPPPATHGFFASSSSPSRPERLAPTRTWLPYAAAELRSNPVKPHARIPFLSVVEPLYMIIAGTAALSVLQYEPIGRESRTHHPHSA